MSHGEFICTRAAARPSASAAGIAPETQARLPAFPQRGTSPPVAGAGRRCSLAPIPPIRQILGVGAVP